MNFIFFFFERTLLNKILLSKKKLEDTFGKVHFLIKLADQFGRDEEQNIVKKHTFSFPKKKGTLLGGDNIEISLIASIFSYQKKYIFLFF